MADVTLKGLLGEFRNYLRDASPGGLLNPEITPERMRNALEYVSMTPTPFGDAASGLLAGNYLMKGMFKDAGLEAIGLLPFVPGMTKRIYYHGGVPYKDVYSNSHNPSDLMGYLGSWWTPNEELAKKFATGGSFASRGNSASGIQKATLRGKILNTQDEFLVKNGLLDNLNSSDSDFSRMESLLLSPSIGRLVGIKGMDWVDMSAKDRMRKSRDILKNHGYAGLSIRDSKVDLGHPQTVIFDPSYIQEIL